MLHKVPTALGVVAAVFAATVIGATLIPHADRSLTGDVLSSPAGTTGDTGGGGTTGGARTVSGTKEVVTSSRWNIDNGTACDDKAKIESHVNPDPTQYALSCICVDSTWSDTQAKNYVLNNLKTVTIPNICKPANAVLTCDSGCVNNGDMTTSVDGPTMQTGGDDRNFRCGTGKRRFCYDNYKWSCTWTQPCKPSGNSSSSSSVTKIYVCCKSGTSYSCVYNSTCPQGQEQQGNIIDGKANCEARCMPSSTSSSTSSSVSSSRISSSSSR